METSQQFCTNSVMLTWGGRNSLFLWETRTASGPWRVCCLNPGKTSIDIRAHPELFTVFIYTLLILFCYAQHSPAAVPLAQSQLEEREPAKPLSYTAPCCSSCRLCTSSHRDGTLRDYKLYWTAAPTSLGAVSWIFLKSSGTARVTQLPTSAGFSSHSQRLLAHGSTTSGSQ